MADLEELTANIWQWGVDRKIHANSTAAAQVRKAFEEFIELLRDLEADEPDVEALKDDIGDIYVCLVQVCGCLGMSVPEPVPEPATDKDWESMAVYLTAIWNRSQVDSAKYIVTNLVADAFGSLADDCDSYGFTLVDAVHKAWNEIKDRKGYLREDGIFVKETA